MGNDKRLYIIAGVLTLCIVGGGIFGAYKYLQSQREDTTSYISEDTFAEGDEEPETLTMTELKETIYKNVYDTLDNSEYVTQDDLNDLLTDDVLSAVTDEVTYNLEKELGETYGENLTDEQITKVQELIKTAITESAGQIVADATGTSGTATDVKKIIAEEIASQFSDFANQVITAQNATTTNLVSQINSLDSRLSSAESSVSTLQSKVSNLSSSSNSSSTYTLSDSDISTIKSKVLSAIDTSSLESNVKSALTKTMEAYIDAKIGSAGGSTVVDLSDLTAEEWSALLEACKADTSVANLLTSDEWAALLSEANGNEDYINALKAWCGATSSTDLSAKLDEKLASGGSGSGGGSNITISNSTESNSKETAASSYVVSTVKNDLTNAYKAYTDGKIASDTLKFIGTKTNENGVTIISFDTACFDD